MLKQFFSIVLLSAAAVFAEAGTSSNFRLNRYFSSNMVLQRNHPILICGHADPGKTVDVSFADEKKTALADRSGSWECVFPARSAGGPYQIEVAGISRKVRYENIMVGDVWVCSGQSNMAMTMAGVQNSKEEIAKAKNSDLRLMSVPKYALSVNVPELLNARWQLCDSKSVRSFSAVGYYFGEKLQQESKVPIGLIDSTWGGTALHSWMPVKKHSDDPAELEKIRQRDIRQKEEESRTIHIAGNLEKDPGLVKKLSAIDLDDSSWEERKLPFYWRRSDREVDGGYYQFRLTLNLPEAWTGKELELNLGKISWADMTYFNGEEIGSHKVLHQCRPFHGIRHYRVPGKLVKAGKNVISLFIGGWNAGLGFHGGERMVLQPAGRANEAISLETVWKYRPVAIIKRPSFVQNMYGSMIYPLFRFPIAGVIWYQGESNTPAPLTYFREFPEMVRDWRMNWGYEFPFYFVQLSWFSPGGVWWDRFRDMQRRCVEIVPNSGMAVCFDHGDRNNIHPPQKKIVGERLAALALKNTYAKSSVSEGPRFVRAEFKEGRATVHFAPLDSPLAVKGEKLTGFELAGTDRVFYPADAEIAGDTVICRSDKVKDPEFIRYEYLSYRRVPKASLQNQAGFPASPFSNEPLFDQKVK